jgi:hypothetical protein
MTARVCTTCALCLRDSYGYSNYTVEGTLLACLAGLNPELEDKEEPWHDVTPELAAILDVAKSCPQYREGTGPALDVEREELPYGVQVTPALLLEKKYADDPEQARLMARWVMLKEIIERLR